MVEKNLFGEEIPEEDIYFLNDGTSINASELRAAERDVQVNAMKNWFYGKFEDPNESCPYDSGDGGYQFIYGGPYDASEQLSEEFGRTVPNEVIEWLARKLDDIAVEWSGRSDVDPDEDRDDYLFQSIFFGEHYQSFSEAITNIRFLLDVSVDGPQQDHFLRLLYLSVITALEAYFFETFTKTVLADKKLLRKFFETDSSKEKIPVRDVFKFVDNGEEYFKEHFVNFVWHRLGSVATLYSNVLGVTIEVSNKLDEAIRVRHDIVHRNGKVDGGKAHIITKETVTELAQEVESLVASIESQMTEDKMWHLQETGKIEPLESMF